MMSAPIPANDTARVAALRAYNILDTDQDDAFDRLTRLAAALLDVPVALINFVDADRQWTKSWTGLDLPELPRGQAFCAYTILQNQPLVVNDARSDPRFADNPLTTSDPGVRFYAAAPLLTPDGFAVGAICVIDHTPREISADKLRLLSELAAIVITTLELYRTARGMRALALTDPLTGLANRTQLIHGLQDAVAAASDTAQPFSLFYLDCDNFKNVNDLHGHHVGDELLRTVAQHLRAAVRASDVAARIGGDEFAAILPGVGVAGARKVAERLQRDCHAALRQRHWPVTLSLGVVTFLSAPTDADEALSIADATMYVAKRNGKAQLRAVSVGQSTPLSRPPLLAVGG